MEKKENKKIDNNKETPLLEANKKRHPIKNQQNLPIQKTKEVKRKNTYEEEHYYQIKNIKHYF